MSIPSFQILITATPAPNVTPVCALCFSAHVSAMGSILIAPGCVEAVHPSGLTGGRCSTGIGLLMEGHTSEDWNSRGCEGTVLRMTLDEAREQIISGIDYAAYRETDSSLHDADKNRLFGSEHYKSGRPIYKTSPWAEGDFEGKMAALLGIANAFNHSVAALREAQRLLENEESVLGRVVRRANSTSV
jgi:hypothetical protein